MGYLWHYDWRQLRVSDKHEDLLGTEAGLIPHTHSPMYIKERLNLQGAICEAGSEWKKTIKGFLCIVWGMNEKKGEDKKKGIE